MNGIENPRCPREAKSAGDADAAVRWDFCRLDFFVTFLVKQKSKERKLILKAYPHFLVNLSFSLEKGTVFCRVNFQHHRTGEVRL
jgi:hypothetical protein